MTAKTRLELKGKRVIRAFCAEIRAKLRRLFHLCERVGKAYLSVLAINDAWTRQELSDARK